MRALLAPLAAARLRRCDVLLLQSHFLPDVAAGLVFGPANAAVELWHVQDAPWKRPGSLANNVLAYANEWAGLLLVRLFFKTVIAGSHLAAGKIGGLKRKNIFVTTNGVEHVRAPRCQAITRSGGVYVGRLHPAKGIDDLLSAWKIVVERFGPQPLEIVGDGDPAYRTRLQKTIDSTSLRECVRLRGAASEDEKHRLLQRASVFVFPSYEEGWGIALAEAMAAGLPCATYDLEIFREIFPAGRLAAPPGRVDVLAQRICDLLSNEALRDELANQATRLAGAFSWRRAADTEASALFSLPAAASPRSMRKRPGDGRPA